MKSENVESILRSRTPVLIFASDVASAVSRLKDGRGHDEPIDLRDPAKAPSDRALRQMALRAIAAGGVTFIVGARLEPRFWAVISELLEGEIGKVIVVLATKRPDREWSQRF